MLEDVDTVLAGRYSEDRRSLLAARLERRDGEPVRALAMNDVVVNKWETGRTIDFETSINGRFVNSHGGDGMVIATATGSTAYALSCGGPIVEPDLDVWVLAPISPHTLSDRPIVVRAGSKVQLRMSDRFDSRAQVTCDGTAIGDLAQGDTLCVESADVQITLLHPPGYDYYRLLRSKLHWGRGGYGSPSDS
jgi:NAD+ kinase